MENTEMKVESGKLGISLDVGKTESQEAGASLEEQITCINKHLVLLKGLVNGPKKEYLSDLFTSWEQDIVTLTAIKENLLVIRNIENSGSSLADKEREAGVSFDSMVTVFKCFIEDVWIMRRSQKEHLPGFPIRADLEKEIDEQLAILVPERKAEQKLTVLGHEGEDYQLNN